MPLKAWQFDKHGEPSDVLRLVDLPPPSPGPGEVLLEVVGATVNFADDLMVRGTYQRAASLPGVPGMELVGRVVGTEERVVTLTSDLVGAYAEYAVARASDVLPAPASFSDPEAAAFLVSYQTSWFALHQRGRLRAGEWVLVHAAAGGVGSAAVQLARAADARVIGIVGSADKVPVAEKLGCEVVVDRSTTPLAEAVLDATAGHGADVVVDPVGGPSFDASVRCVAWEGRIVVVGFTSGVFPRVRAEHAMVKNYGVLGLHWGAYRDRDVALVRRAHDELTTLADTGLISPLVGAVEPFARAREALAQVSSGQSRGRVVLLL